jgi:hypothetical protein
MKAKYIRTADNQIIIFGEGLKHSDFKHFNPASAGFISIGVNKDKNPVCECFGESESLKLKTDERDTYLAQSQILGINY